MVVFKRPAEECSGTDPEGAAVKNGGNGMSKKMNREQRNKWILRGMCILMVVAMVVAFIVVYLVQ